MSGSGGKVLARRVAEEVCFLVVGRVGASHCPALRQFAEDNLARGATRVQFDLRDCTHCDSTFLGTLIRMRDLSRSHGRGALRLVCPSPQVLQILTQIGALTLFHIVEDTPAGISSEMTWQQLEDQVDKRQTMRFKRTVTDAHQALAGEGGELGERFGAVAEAMRQELMSGQDSGQGSS